jgi:hypothetical protein
LISQASRVVGAPKGSVASTLSISSGDRRIVSAPPIASSEVEAKKAVPLTSVVITCVSTMRVSRCSMRCIHISRYWFISWFRLCVFFGMYSMCAA